EGVIGRTALERQVDPDRDVEGMAAAPAAHRRDPMAGGDRTGEPHMHRVGDKAEGVHDVALPGAVPSNQHRELLKNDSAVLAEAPVVRDGEARDHRGSSWTASVGCLLAARSMVGLYHPPLCSGEARRCDARRSMA